jgi:hypothetical protein
MAVKKQPVGLINRIVGASQQLERGAEMAGDKLASPFSLKAPTGSGGCYQITEAE